MDESLIKELINKAGEAASKHYNNKEIAEVLNSEDDFEKPVAILSLETLEDKKDAKLLTEHLTGCDGRIREASALKISEFLHNEKTAEYFLDEKGVKTILNGRALIEGIKTSASLQELILPLLLERIEELIENLKELSKTPFRENKLNNRKNHAKNKVVFNLYWAMEALYHTKFNKNYREKVLNILNFTNTYIDYTIREKTAKILSKTDNAPDNLLQKLKNDENFYVKNQLLC